MMRFAQAEYLQLLWILIPCIAIIIWSQYSWKKKRKSIGTNEEQRQKILPRVLLRRSLISSILISCALIFWIIAMSQPQYGQRAESAKKAVSDVFIAVDVSRSMFATDVKPTRLARAKIFAANLIEELGSERISIIPFAGHAYVTMPLTTDIGAAKMVLQSLDKNTASTQGTAISAAIRLAIQSAEALEPRRRVMVLLTDGENFDQEAVKAAEEAAEAGITIFPIGVGTEEGSRLPAPPNSGSQFLHDSDGSIVISRYNPDLLRKIASKTGGAAYNILSGSRIIKDIKERVNKLDSKVIAMENFKVKNNFYWLFLVTGILFILVALYIENYRKK